MFSREASANISRSGSLRSSIKRSRACSHALLDRAIIVTAKRAYTKGQATSSSVFTMHVAHQAGDCAIHARTNSVGSPTACARLRAQRDGMYTDSHTIHDVSVKTTQSGHLAKCSVPMMKKVFRCTHAGRPDLRLLLLVGVTVFLSKTTKADCSSESWKSIRCHAGMDLELKEVEVDRFPMVSKIGVS